MAGPVAFFERSLYGKALRATAMNRSGPAWSASPPRRPAGSLLAAAAIGALSGILISPIATVYYDTGLMIGLKGFVGAILGGMLSLSAGRAGRPGGRPARSLSPRSGRARSRRASSSAS
jgi:branched-chain amino acid transport system permease protein